MKKGIISFYCFLQMGNLFAQTGADSDKQLLLQILKERQEHFSTYTKSLEEASGIFGMKTKKDIRHSNDILIEIVKMDNRLIGILDRQLNYKDFEKTTMNYRSLDDQKAMDRLQQNIVLSDAKIQEMSAALQDDQQKLNNRNRIIAILLLLLLIFVYRMIAQKRNTKESENLLPLPS